MSDRARPKTISKPLAEMDTVPGSTCLRYGLGLKSAPSFTLGQHHPHDSDPSFQDHFDGSSAADMQQESK